MRALVYIVEAEQRLHGHAAGGQHRVGQDAGGAAHGPCGRMGEALLSLQTMVVDSILGKYAAASGASASTAAMDLLSFEAPTAAQDATPARDATVDETTADTWEPKREDVAVGSCGKVPEIEDVC